MFHESNLEEITLQLDNVYLVGRVEAAIFVIILIAFFLSTVYFANKSNKSNK